MASSVSKVTIGNMALGHIGTDNTIEAFTETSPQAKQIDLWYDFAREQALAEYDWNFARKRLAMSVHAEDPPSGVWAYRYQYPSDAIVCREIEKAPTETVVPFDIETAGTDNSLSVLTDRATATMKYTRDVQDTNLFSPHFVQALGYLLAHYVAFALTRKKTVKEDMMTAYRQLVPLAAAHNFNESGASAPPEGGAVQARS